MNRKRQLHDLWELLLLTKYKHGVQESCHEWFYHPQMTRKPKNNNSKTLSVLLLLVLRGTVCHSPETKFIVNIKYRNRGPPVSLTYLYRVFSSLHDPIPINHKTLTRVCKISSSQSSWESFIENSYEGQVTIRSQQNEYKNSSTCFSYLHLD